MQEEEIKNKSLDKVYISCYQGNLADIYWI